MLCGVELGEISTLVVVEKVVGPFDVEVKGQQVAFAMLLLFA